MQRLSLKMMIDIMVYEIEFIKDNIEYEYTIHAVSGKILEFDYEYDD